jgi:hypothetical protein
MPAKGSTGMKQRKEETNFIQTISLSDEAVEPSTIASINDYLKSPAGIRDTIIRELEICRLESDGPSPPSKELPERLAHSYGIPRTKRVPFPEPSKWEIHTSEIKALTHYPLLALIFGIQTKSVPAFLIAARCEVFHPDNPEGTNSNPAKVAYVASEAGVSRDTILRWREKSQYQAHVKAIRVSASLSAADRAKRLPIFLRLAQFEAALPDDPERHIAAPGAWGEIIQSLRKQPGYQALVEALRANRGK